MNLRGEGIFRGGFLLTKTGLTLVNMDVNLMPNKEVIFYRKLDGTCPVEEFLEQLNSKDARKVAWVLSLIEDLNVIPAHYFSKMSGTDNIWECRVKFGSNIYRIFSFWDKHQIVLTHGFAKKTQKTPVEEIFRAEASKKDYFHNKGRQS